MTFYANSKYIKFFKLNFTCQKLRTWGNSPDFRKRGETPEKKNQEILMKIMPSDSANLRTLL